MGTLFDISKAMNDLVDQDTGEILDFEAFEALSMEKDDKISNIALWCMELDADIKNYDDQLARFKEKKERAVKKHERLQEYLGLFLAGQEYKDGAGRFTIKYRKSKSVVIDDESLLNERFVKTETVKKIDKIAIREALKNEDVPGAHIEEKSNLRIE